MDAKRARDRMNAKPTFTFNFHYIFFLQKVMIRWEGGELQEGREEEVNYRFSQIFYFFSYIIPDLRWKQGEKEKKIQRKAEQLTNVAGLAKTEGVEYSYGYLP
jgi:hypothetical protein